MKRSVWGVSVQGVSFGGSLFGRVSIRETPPYGNERAVRILLECILVFMFNSTVHIEGKYYSNEFMNTIIEIILKYFVG